MDLHSILTFKIEAGPVRIVVWEVLYVVVLLQVLAVVLNRFLFRPVMTVLDERRARLQQASEARDAALKSLEAATREHAHRLGSARREALLALDTARKEAEQVRRVELEQARKTAEGRVTIAREAVAKSTKKAEHELKLSALQLGRQIASTVLGREVA